MIPPALLIWLATRMRGSLNEWWEGLTRWIVAEAWPWFDAVPAIVFDYAFSHAEAVGIDLSPVQNALRCADFWLCSDYLLLLTVAYLDWFLGVWAVKAVYKILPSLLGGH